MFVLTVLNQKGGVGKTCTTFHLAGMLAGLGRRVLMIDNDPQASLTQVLWGSATTAEMPASKTIAAIYDEESPNPGQVIRSTGFEGLAIVPGHERATLANVPDLDSVGRDRAMVLGDWIEYVRDDFDFVFIDCPSNLQFVSYAALVASDGLIVPIVPEDLGTQGIAGVNRLVDRVRAGFNPNLRLMGYLLSMVTRKTVHVLFEGTLRGDYGDQVFRTSIQSLPAYCEAIMHAQPISVFKPKGVPGARMRELAEEVIVRSVQMHPVEELV